MKITDAGFVKSVYKLSALPREVKPEIAFSGRSNVGKSSLINTLLNRKGIAKTSSTPGRTQCLNFIEVNHSVHFVDLPGYGYARVPDAVKQDWQSLIDGYLEARENLKLVILIIDSRRDPMADERLFVDWLKLKEISFKIVLTKTDKLKLGKKARSQSVWKKFLEVEDALLFSALTGEGKSGVWQVIDQHLNLK